MSESVRHGAPLKTSVVGGLRHTSVPGEALMVNSVDMLEMWRRFTMLWFLIFWI